MNYATINKLLFLAGLFAVLSLTPRAQAATKELSCLRASQGNHQLIIEVCDASSTEYLVRVKTFKRPGQLKTEVNALFVKGEQIWSRVWTSVGDGRFTSREQNRLARVAAEAIDSTEAPSILTETKTLSFVSLLANFLAPNTSIENFDANLTPAASPRVWGANALGHWTPICEFIGETRFAQYSLPKVANPIFSLWMVGDPATDCKGRCGWGCSQAVPQHKKNQYTQECFNHDVCYSETGALLGVCKETFWIAAASYVFAPDCNSPQKSLQETK